MLNILFNACDPGVEAQVLQLFTQYLASLTQVQLFHGDQGLFAVTGSQSAVLALGPLITSDCTALSVI